MWEPRRLTTLWDFTAWYRDSFSKWSESHGRPPFDLVLSQFKPSPTFTAKFSQIHLHLIIITYKHGSFMCPLSFICPSHVSVWIAQSKQRRTIRVLSCITMTRREHVLHLSLLSFLQEKNRLMRSPCCSYVYVPISDFETVDFHETSYQHYATGGHPNDFFFIS
jgi:hypothetical protein